MWECLPPKPSTPYHRAKAFHIAIDDKLEIKIVEGSPRALYCADARASAKEFRLHNALSSVGVGMPGILAGKFIDSEGATRKDLYRNEIGAVIIAHDPDLITVGDVSQFLSLERNGSWFVVANGPELNLDKNNPEAFVREQMRLARLLGKIKAQAALDAGVMRHTGHLGNFLINPKSGSIFMSDLDSCAEAESIESHLRGPQMLRDFASDTNRMIISLTFCAHSPTFLRKLEDGTFKPFQEYLSGLYDRLLPAETINERAADLQREYIVFTRSIGKILDHAHQMALKSAVASAGTGRAPDMATPQMLWHFAHSRFLSECLLANYDLMQLCSGMKDRGFGLPQIERDRLKRQFSSGIDLYEKAMKDEHRRVTGREFSFF